MANEALNAHPDKASDAVSGLPSSRKVLKSTARHAPLRVSSDHVSVLLKCAGIASSTQAQGVKGVEKRETLKGQDCIKKVEQGGAPQVKIYIES